MLTIPEVEKDLVDSQSDIESLAQIVSGLRLFISNPCGENREFLRKDLWKWESMQATAVALHGNIEAKLAQLKTQQNSQN